MRGVNKAIVLGNLGNDPELKNLPSGAAVCSLSVATTEKWKDKQTGQEQEHTEWHRISLFGRMAEVAAEYLRKGSQVYIEGRLRTRKWQDKEGKDRYSTEIVASDLQLLGGRGNSSGAPAPARAASKQQPADNKPTEQFRDDDDIPF